MIIVQAVNIVPAVIVTLNVLLAFAVMGVVIVLQAMPVTQITTMNMAVHGGQAPEMMPATGIVPDINIVLATVPAAQVLMAVGLLGHLGMLRIIVVLPNIAQEELVKLLLVPQTQAVVIQL